MNIFSHDEAYISLGTPKVDYPILCYDVLIFDEAILLHRSFLPLVIRSNGKHKLVMFGTSAL